VTKALLFAAIAVVPLLIAACGGDDDRGSGGNSGSSPPVRTPAAAATASGPSATLSPRNGPPGTEVTVSGSGWTAGATVTVEADLPGQSVPYSTVTANTQGAFTVQFRLEKQPNGADLQTGRFNLIARSGSTQVVLPFQVDSRRPVQGPGPGGG
jgi:hypothetical protein